jgi:hypothetical protein
VITGELERSALAVGDMLAEGGEGRVHELLDHPGSVYKAYRNPVPAAPLRSLVGWPAALESSRPDLAARVRASSAWPSSLVVDGDTGMAAGLVVPRAPAQFWVRHRDGGLRLSSLSYLTADPRQRAAAYGLSLPLPMAAERVGLAYALARLLEALEAWVPSAAHGDLSAKNVLWSLERGPEVFVIDCDNAELYWSADGNDAASERRRASTPNWDDPAVPTGSSPGPFSDRYSLALIFLRIAGAAHFPIQGRQRRGEPVSIDFELPATARQVASLSRSAPLWRMAAWGLDVREPCARPTAATWAAALEQVLEEMGAGATVRQVWGAQEGRVQAQPSLPREPVPDRMPTAVRVRPVAQTARTQAWRVVTSGEATSATTLPAEPAGVVVRRYLRHAAVWWWLAHRRVARSLITGGSRGAGARRLVVLAFTDFAMGCIGLFLFAMIVSPFLGL